MLRSLWPGVQKVWVSPRLDLLQGGGCCKGDIVLTKMLDGSTGVCRILLHAKMDETLASVVEILKPVAGRNRTWASTDQLEFVDPSNFIDPVIYSRAGQTFTILLPRKTAG